MPAEDREQERGTQQSVPPAAGVSMRALLASCAAADAVSKPPHEGPEAIETEKAAEAAEAAEAVERGGDLRGRQPEQDAA
jgi:hypothetical protein